jgi:hypothetical protein
MLPNIPSRQKRFIIASILVVLVVALLSTVLYQALSSPPRFRASSLVFMTPFPKGVLLPSFQTRAFLSMPTVHLEQRGAGGIVEVVAYATTAGDVQTNANEATVLLLRAVSESFGTGVHASIVRRADSARRTSIFHDHR